MAKSNGKPEIVIVAGPTGVGKTASCIELANRCGGEIISADSVAVYRYMDIGSAKPTPAERAAAPHHLIDLAYPDETYDAARFSNEADRVIRDLHSRGKPAIIAGGTGLYIKALTHGLFTETPNDPEVRDRLRAEAGVLGPVAMHEKLAAVDEKAAARIHPNDSFRVIRALEVVETTGRPISEQQEEHGFREAPYDTLVFCLWREREELYERINQRVEAMIGEGLVDEVAGLLDMGYSPELKSMSSLGYRHMCEHLAGKADLDTAVRAMARDTRRFAKRQFTWFRKHPGVEWIHADQPEALFEPAITHLRA
ncbi:MAG: tRNA (adenosine(37)-N6)-dimethylallyltransferase MiaA [Desulfatibacillaceae bacterium]